MSAANTRIESGATLRLVATYALFACVWILLSDQAVVWIFQDPKQIARVSSLKGWFFVAVTSAMLYGLIQRYLHRIANSLREETAAREQNNRSLELLSAVVESTEDAIFAKDLQGRYILFNQAACHFVGQPKEAVLCHDDQALFPPEQAAMLRELDRRVVAEKRVRTTEEVLSTPTGERIFLATKGPLCDAQGTVIGTYGISREMTAHKNMLLRLRASEERLRMALEASNEGLWDWDLLSNAVFRSPRYFELTGCPDNGFSVGMEHLRALLQPEDVEPLMQALEALRSGARPSLEQDFRLAAPQGTVRWLRTRGRTVEHDGQGMPLRIVGTLCDVSAQKQAEEHLRELNLELESKVAQRSQELMDLYNHAPCGYHSLSVEGIVLRVNQTELNLLGYTQEEYVGQQIETFLTPASVLTYRAQFEQFLQSGQMRNLELEFICKNGQLLPLLVTADMARDAQGQAVMSRSTVIDNSAHRAQTQRILDLNKFLNEVLEVLPFGVVVLDLQGHVILRNQLFAKLLDYPAALMDTQPLRYSDLLRYNHGRGDYPGQTADAMVARFTQLFELRQSNSFERQQASGIYLEIRGQPISSQWTLLTFTDVSAHKAAEQSLMAARHVAEAATEAKSEFLANMSHEIRTPMNGILGLAYLLQKAALPPDAARLARKISHTGLTLQGILNDILDFSKIEAGHLELEQTSFWLGDVLESVATIMVTDLSQPDIELAIAPPPMHLPALLGDPLRIGQVLTNLVGNAIKFTTRGNVTLAVTKTQMTAQRVSLRFSVRDTGIGISAAKIEEIFKPFSQADASTTRRYGGTGLGLAISRRLVDMMGSQLQVHSVEGSGSEFWFELDLPWAEPSEHRTHPMQNLEVLVADDQAISREALRSTILGLGWKPSVVEGGQAALQHLRGRSAQDEPEVLLLDWKMPDLDGLSVARQVNQAMQGAQGPILIMATAHSRDELQAHPDSHLVDAILSKPVTPSSLYDAVLSALQKRRGLAAHPIGQATLRLAGLRLLVVDDSEINLEIAQLIFSAEGAHVETARNGQEALTWLQAHPTGIDLVLMDVQMPVLDGMRATQQIRAIPALRGLPIVALTAGAFKINEEAALAAGMNEHLSKPMDVEKAVAVILRLTGHAAPLQTPAIPASAQAQATPAAPSLALNLARGLEIWRDGAVYQQYLRKFVRDYAGFAATASALPLPALLAGAHKLRGAAGNLALEQVADAAAALDTLAEQGHTAQGLQPLQAALEAACVAIAAYAGTDSQASTAPAVRTAPPDITALLEKVLHQLGRDTPQGMEPLLQSLDAALPGPHTASLRRAVENFNFRAGEAIVRRLAQELQLPLADA